MSNAFTQYSSAWHRRASAGLLALALSGCATIAQVQTRNQEGISMTSHEVTITRTAVIHGTPEAVFDFIAAEDVLPKVLTGYGPLPAVKSTSQHSGPWDTPGSARMIHLADGSTVREQITHYDRAGHFAYRVWEFGNPIIRTLATGARGEWTFAADPAGTRVQWTYTFTAKNGVTALPLSAITQVLWRGYMDVCLANARRLLASPATAS